MANHPGTPLRHIRIADELWEAAGATAKARGENISLVVRNGLKEYVHRHNSKNGGRKSSPPPPAADENDTGEGDQLTLAPPE